MTPDQFADVLRAVESGGEREAWGDNGRAFTSYQCHIDWLFDWSRRLCLYPEVDEQTDAFVRRVVIKFYLLFVAKFLPVEIAMYYHLGHSSIPGALDWDLQYARRWSESVAKLGIAAT